jgi:hypothetical protein
LLAAGALATLLPSVAALASEEPRTETQLRCRIGNGKGASYGKGIYQCLLARARGKEVAWEIVEVPVVKQEQVAKKEDKK